MKAIVLNKTAEPIVIRWTRPATKAQLTARTEYLKRFRAATARNRRRMDKPEPLGKAMSLRFEAGPNEADPELVREMMVFATVAIDDTAARIERDLAITLPHTPEPEKLAAIRKHRPKEAKPKAAE